MLKYHMESLLVKFQKIWNIPFYKTCTENIPHILPKSVDVYCTSAQTVCQDLTP